MADVLFRSGVERRPSFLRDCFGAFFRSSFPSPSHLSEKSCGIGYPLFFFGRISFVLAEHASHRFFFRFGTGVVYGTAPIFRHLSDESGTVLALEVPDPPPS